MLEKNIDLWDEVFDQLGGADVRVITTNGSLKANGEAVMGKGCALEATRRYPRLPNALGTLLRTYGNHAHFFQGYNLITFPTKHQWFDEEADPKLIYRSLDELLKIVNAHKFSKVLMPRPGTGSGRLNWLAVRSIVAERLDDRFLVVDYPSHHHRKANVHKVYDVHKETW